MLQGLIPCLGYYFQASFLTFAFLMCYHLIDIALCGSEINSLTYQQSLLTSRCTMSYCDLQTISYEKVSFHC